MALISEELLKKLRSVFDLNIYEAKIWVALLSKGVATAGELSEVSDVPRSRTYDVLESLEKRSFVVMKIGKPIKYLAVKPSEVFSRVKKQFSETAEEQIKMLENVEKTDVLKELQLLFTNGIENIDPLSISAALKGRKNIYRQISSMLETATKSVTIVTTSKGLLRKGDYFKNAFKKLSDKGVKIKIAAPLNESTKEVANALSQFVKVNNVNNVKARFVVVDGNEIMFMTNSDDSVHESFDIGIWVKSPFFANALENMFNQAN